MKSKPHDESSPAEKFWEDRYRDYTRSPDGRPSWVLARFARFLPEGRALDLGCGLGDDTIWLARRGWRVVAVDISAAALTRAEENARDADVDDIIDFQRHDLANTFPDGSYDLVSAQYLHSPIEFPRTQVLKAAAGAVASGGLLLISEHASVAPWSWAAPDTVFPTPEESLAALELDLSDWHREFVGAPEREAIGPNGQRATVTDNVIALQRLVRRSST